MVGKKGRNDAGSKPWQQHLGVQVLCWCPLVERVLDPSFLAGCTQKYTSSGSSYWRRGNCGADFKESKTWILLLFKLLVTPHKSLLHSKREQTRGLTSFVQQNAGPFSMASDIEPQARRGDATMRN